jgi:hypothetical protein
MPVWEYSHDVGQSITGGFIYRGASLPDLIGAYIYADYVSGKIWSLRHDGSSQPQNQLLLETEVNIASFGVDSSDELYLCAFDGKIYQLKPVGGQ